MSDISPSSHTLPVTTHDTNDVLTGKTFNSLYIGVGGTVVIVEVGGNTATFLNVTGGGFFPVKGRKVHTDTTATNIVASFGGA